MKVDFSLNGIVRKKYKIHIYVVFLYGIHYVQKIMETIYQPASFYFIHSLQDGIRPVKDLHYNFFAVAKHSTRRVN